MERFNWLKAFQNNAFRTSSDLQRKLYPSNAVLKQLEREHRLYHGLDSVVMRDMQRYLVQQEHLAGLSLNYMNGLAAAKAFSSEQTRWGTLLDRLQRQGLTSSSLNAAVLPSVVWTSSMDEVLSGLMSVQMPSLYPQLADRLISPYTGYSRFARQTIARLGNADEANEAGALSGAMVLAEEQVAEAADLLTTTVEEPDTEPIENDGLMPELKPRLLQVQRRELLIAREIPADADVAILMSLAPSAALAAQAREIVATIVRCNRRARGLGDEDVFTPTTTFIEAQNTLSWIAVVDIRSLGDLVDSLYLMLYEGAGKDKLRYLEYIERHDCGVIWIIKHLRNKWLRHDPDHGKPADIRKSHADLRTALGELGMNGQPRRKDEFQQIHKNLLDRVGELLNRLEDALVARETA